MPDSITTNSETPRPLRVFLCHASGDKPAVRDLYRRLCADGFAPWLDEEDLLPGQDWQIEIPQAVREADVVLVCLSPHSINKTGYVQKEIKFALDVADEQPEGTIFLIPLKLEECVVPERLRRWHWVNHFEANGYARLIRSLRVRADKLGLSAAPTASTGAAAALPPAETAPVSAVTNVSGGVNVEARNVAVGNDVVGRDKIIQAGTYIEHATIIQAGAPVPESKSTTPASTENRRVIGGMEFVRVPAGKFIMGSDRSGEKPQHTVEIPYDYWMGRYPVTNEQFAWFVTATKYKFDQGDWQKKANHPVVNISWRDALAYCQWLNQTLRGELKDLTLRLPTEAEWEKAARGTQGNEWPWGNEFDTRKYNTYEGGKGGTTPVGAYSPRGDSPYGCADMAGNVWEWTTSIYKKYPYGADDGREDLSDQYAPRVLRGGSWSGSLDGARCACRFYNLPVNRDDGDGFRLCVPGF